MNNWIWRRVLSLKEYKILIILINFTNSKIGIGNEFMLARVLSSLFVNKAIKGLGLFMIIRVLKFLITIKT